MCTPLQTVYAYFIVYSAIYTTELTVSSIICFLCVRRTFVRIWIKFSVSFSELLIEFPLLVLHQSFSHHTHAQIPEIALLYRQTFFWQMAAKSQNNRGKNAGTCLKASLKRFFTLYIPWKSSCFDTDAMSLLFWTVSKKTQI